MSVSDCVLTWPILTLFGFQPEGARRELTQQHRVKASSGCRHGVHADVVRKLCSPFCEQHLYIAIFRLSSCFAFHILFAGPILHIVKGHLHIHTVDADVRSACERLASICSLFPGRRTSFG
jgi:hypothetical protein